jgi:hypothetical protein
MNLIEIETELKKRLVYPYIWGKRQNNYYNGLTNFIYKTFRFEALLKEIDSRFKGKTEYKDFLNYALNRWFNFWSAQAIERIFCSLPEVEPALNSKNRLIDFTIKSVTFDHKTSIFPNAYPGTLIEAQKNPADLIEWLYDNQSQEQRKHLKNRLFIILYSHNKQHWKLKAEISWLINIIRNYVNNFDPNKLLRFSFEQDSITLSDVIWAIKEK